MLHLAPPEPAVPAAPTPLMLSDRLISLAEAAEHAGLRATATRLVRLACTVLDEAPVIRMNRPVLCRKSGLRGTGSGLPGKARVTAPARGAVTTHGCSPR